MAQRVDVHSHVFNGGYLPLAGILQQKFGVPKWTAIAVEFLIHDRMGKGVVDCSRQAGSGANVLSADVPADLSELEEEDLIDLILGPPDLTASAAEPDFDDELDEAAWTNFASGGGVSALGAGDVWKRLLRLLAELVDTGKALLRWLAVLVSHECDVAARLHNTIHGVDLYVHHMMDMANHYPGVPYYAFWDEQIDRMRSLAQQPGAKLVGFVAFDPRREDGVEKVEEALKSGFAGVKFYPPNGYRPIDNVGNAEFDQRCNDVFDLCCDLKSPLFSHCTEFGFEARPGYGRFSDPLGWKKVLISHPDLRLCLGHAGGASDWLGQSLGPYARTVVELCETYDNVYCEMGHFEEIIDRDRHLVLRNRLHQMIQMYPDLKNKVMFGSDWHVMALGEYDVDKYIASFEKVFEGPLASMKQAFFGENAIKYLNLAAFETNSAGALSPQESEMIRLLQGNV